MPPEKTSDDQERKAPNQLWNKAIYGQGKSPAENWQKVTRPIRQLSFEQRMAAQSFFSKE